MDPRWDAPHLAVSSDSPRTARYRRLQSLWRESMLGAAPGQDAQGKPIGSWLIEPSDGQWLTPIVAAYVRDRVPQARAEGELLEDKRLRTNLMSSQPLCFNIFGQFAAFPMAAGRTLGRTFGLPIERLDAVLVEHAPPTAKARLEDKTSFDAYVTYCTPSGERRFLAVETKYTEPFGTAEYTTAAKEAATDDPNGWFHPGSAPAASGRATNQLWRNCLLAQLHEQTNPDKLTGTAAVLCTEGDKHAADAVEGLRPLLKDPERTLRQATLETLIAEASAEPELRAWAAAFDHRYLRALG